MGYGFPRGVARGRRARVAFRRLRSVRRTRLLGTMAPQPLLLCSTTCTTSDLPDTSNELSVRALPSRPGWSFGCMCSLLPRRSQTSPSSEGWSPSVCVTRPNRVCERWAHTFAVRGVLPRCLQGSLPWSPDCSPGGVTPHLGVRGFMLKELLACLLPFKQVDSLRLTWRNRSHGGHRGRTRRRDERGKK